MTKLDKLIKLNNLETQNGKNRFEELTQHEFYGDIEDIFDPLNKTLNAISETWLSHNEHNLALSEQTLRAIDWQNQELDKQTNMIQQAGSQISETALQMGETASRIVENTSKINETLKGIIKETQDIAPVFVLHDMGAQTNPQLKLEPVDLPTRRYNMNGVNITLEQGAFLFRDNVYEFSERYTDFLTKTNVTYNDTIEEDENKIKRFLKDIRYDAGKGDKKSARYRTIKHIMGVKDDVYGRG